MTNRSQQDAKTIERLAKYSAISTELALLMRPASLRST